jgi:hypothetical protein
MLVPAFSMLDRTSLDSITAAPRARYSTPMFFAENIGNLFYQHPKYEYGKNRFKKVEDYYSLGIVLLEIAFWKTCHDMWQSGRYKSLDRDAFKEKLVEKFVPGLAAVMGTAYRDAVSICLRWEFNADDTERTFSQDTDSHFFRQVVQKLEACHVG